MSYNRDNVVSYAKQYAYNYNPNYIDYATYEGSSDCANSSRSVCMPVVLR